MKFTKMQGLGNDYLYVFAAALPPHVAALTKRLSDRHFGAGADGMIFILPSDKADFMMRIFNADGSEAEMCGNGIRCVGKYVYDKGYTDKTRLTVETLAGIKTLALHVANGSVQTVTVDMGHVTVGAPQTVTAAESAVQLLPVNMGNPHAVVFVNNAEDAPLATVGAALSVHPSFPDGVNVEFVSAADSTHLRMRVWERGSGVTLACGTGACAAVAAAIAAGFCAKNTAVTVMLDGGALTVQVDENGGVTMTGPAETVFEGETDHATECTL